jgi:hypothetical protein
MELLPKIPKKNDTEKQENGLEALNDCSSELSTQHVPSMTSINSSRLEAETGSREVIAGMLSLLLSQ